MVIKCSEAEDCQDVVHNITKVISTLPGVADNADERFKDQLFEFFDKILAVLQKVPDLLATRSKILFHTFLEKVKDVLYSIADFLEEARPDTDPYWTTFMTVLQEYVYNLIDYLPKFEENVEDFCERYKFPIHFIIFNTALIPAKVMGWAVQLIKYVWNDVDRIYFKIIGIIKSIYDLLRTHFNLEYFWGMSGLIIAVIIFAVLLIVFFLIVTVLEVLAITYIIGGIMG